MPSVGINTENPEAIGSKVTYATQGANKHARFT